VLNRGAEGIRLLLEAYNAFTAAGDRVAIVYTLCDIAEALRAPEWASAEDLQKAQGYLKEGLALVDRARQPALLLWLTEGLALTAQRQGKLEDSFEHLKEARRVMERGIDPDNPSWVQYRMGSVLLGMGRSSDALTELRAALPSLRKKKDTLHVAFTLLAQAEALAALGRTSQAEVALSEADAEVQRLGIPRLKVMYFKTAAVVAASGNNYRAAYEKSLLMAEAQRDEPLRLPRSLQLLEGGALTPKCRLDHGAHQELNLKLFRPRRT